MCSSNELDTPSTLAWNAVFLEQMCSSNELDRPSTSARNAMFLLESPPAGGEVPKGVSDTTIGTFATWVGLSQYVQLPALTEARQQHVTRVC